MFNIAKVNIFILLQFYVWLTQGIGTHHGSEVGSFCPKINTENGQVVHCHHPTRPKQKIECTLHESQEYSVASFRCDKFWRHKTDSAITVKQVCVNGHWLREDSHFDCVPKCGLWHKNGDSYQNQDFPWTVEIYGKGVASTSKTEGFEYLCQGTLISPRAILTVAQCVTLPNSKIERRIEDIKFSIFDRTTEFNTDGTIRAMASSTRLVDLKKTVVHPQYNHQTFSKNLAIIWLKHPVKLEAYRVPVCLFNVAEASTGLIEVMDEYGPAEPTPVKIKECRQKMFSKESDEHVCADIHAASDDSSTCKTIGVGIFVVQEETGIWTIKGVGSGSQKKESSFPGPRVVDCNADLRFTDIASVRTWIDKELAREPPINDETDEVLLNTEETPALDDRGHAVTTRTPNFPKEREPLTPEPFLVPNYHTPRPSDAELFPNSETEKRFEPTTTKPPHRKHDSNATPFYGVLPTRFPLSTRKPTTTTSTERSTPRVINPEVDSEVVYEIGRKPIVRCPQLPQPKTGVMQTCQHDDYGDVDDCSNGGVVGTVTTAQCMMHYMPGLGPSSVKRHCQPSGTWSHAKELTCTLECGISAIARKSYIVNGTVSDRISWPWHATIFKKVGHDTRYVCGGSLISKSVILTAAHCVTEKGTSNISDKGSFRVVLASISSNYTKNLIDPVSKSNLFYVKSILVPELYSGLTFESDIALLQLEFPVELSDYVKPVCFPFQNKENEQIELLQLSPGTLGQTVGFGIDETGMPSTNLREAKLPVVSHRDCARGLGRIPSVSQFCAGFTNGTAVCNGDSGSGLYFSVGTGYTNRFIVQGVVSHGHASPYSTLICNHETYAVFTKVRSFSNWVQTRLNELEPE